MIAVEQTELGDRGDCFRACVASVLELPLWEVPEVSATEDGDMQGTFTRLSAWLLPMGLDAVAFRIPEGEPIDWYSVPEGYWIALVRTGASFDHAVVMRGPDVAHDPDPHSPDAADHQRLNGTGHRLDASAVAAAVVFTPRDPARLVPEGLAA